MAYAKMNPIVWWWRRRRLESAIAWAHVDDDARARETVVTRLQGCPLLVAVQDLPEMALNADGTLAESVSLQMLTSEGEEGQVLLVFTSLAEVQQRVGSAGTLAVPLQTIVNSMGPQCTGIVLNPAGRWAYVPRSALPGGALAG